MSTGELTSLSGFPSPPAPWGWRRDKPFPSSFPGTLFLVLTSQAQWLALPHSKSSSHPCLSAHFHTFPWWASPRPRLCHVHYAGDFQSCFSTMNAAWSYWFGDWHVPPSVFHMPFDLNTSWKEFIISISPQTQSSWVLSLLASKHPGDKAPIKAAAIPCPSSQSPRPINSSSRIPSLGLPICPPQPSLRLSNSNWNIGALEVHSAGTHLPHCLDCRLTATSSHSS